TILSILLVCLVNGKLVWLFRLGISYRWASARKPGLIPGRRALETDVQVVRRCHTRDATQRIGGIAMSYPPSCQIHPAAVISPQAQLGENVEVGALAVIDGPVTIGDDCVIRPGAYLFGPISLGHGNLVCTGAILGERPQHLKYNDEPTSVEIGDRNIFREQVTIHRGTTHSMKPVIGNDNFFMVNSHIAHDC